MDWHFLMNPSNNHLFRFFSLRQQFVVHSISDVRVSINHSTCINGLESTERSWIEPSQVIHDYIQSNSTKRPSRKLRSSSHLQLVCINTTQPTQISHSDVEFSLSIAAHENHFQFHFQMKFCAIALQQSGQFSSLSPTSLIALN